MTDYDVAIVGFGPVGAVAACLFGQAGLKTLVLDRTDRIYDKPRAVALDHEIARVLQNIGLADALTPHVAPFTDSRFFGVGGTLIKHLTMAPEPYPLAWTPSMVFMQPPVEQLLRDRAATSANVTIRLNQTMETFTQDDTGVTLQTSGEAGAQTFRTKYLIGCDGASSTVRRIAGLELDDLGFDQPWLVVDIMANEAGLARLPTTSVQYCDPTRPTTFVICTGNHRRWEIRLNDDEDPRAMEHPEAVWRLLSRWITPQEATLWRSASYRFHALVAKEWRNNRVFIAGDAAHQQPPFLGQGLCQGVRDIANLAWKLQARLAGHAPDALLDSYGTERGAHVRRLTTIIKGIGGIVGERDPAAASARDARLLAEAGGTIRPVPRQDLMPGLAAGALAEQDHPARGTLFPQPWIETAQGPARLDDVVGPGAVLVLAQATDVDASAVPTGVQVVACATADRTAAGVIVIQEQDGVLRDWFARHKVAAALVRPDHYVFGVATGQE